jgi:hypothetical protein
MISAGLKGRRSRGTEPPTIRWEEPGRAPSALPALIAGITSAVLPILIPTLFAWVLARAARREIRASDNQLWGRRLVTVAFILTGYSLLGTAGLVTAALSRL